MSGYNNQSPKLLKNILDEFVAQQGLEMEIKISRLPAIWNEVVGIKAASVSRFNRFENGNLFIDTVSSTWRAELMIRREAIRQDINKKLGGEDVKEIIIK